MDQIKIGKFIAECRKKNNLTQMQLAEKLNITDRAISKWENGKAMPDSSIMLELCNELKINVNELLNGEMVKTEEYDRKIKELLLELSKQDEIKNKKLITSMCILTLTTLIFFIGIIMLALYTLKEGPLLGAIICVSTTITLIIAFYVVKLGVDAGYYECKNCHHKFTPTYKEMMRSMNVLTTTHLKCPKCNKRTWCKKVLKK